MIDVVLGDGTQRSLYSADVKLTWREQEGGEEIDYGLDEVRALMLFGPTLSTMAGMWKGMPVMGIAFTDDSGLRVEVPLPLGFANDLGQQLIKETDRYATQVKLAGGNGKQALQRYMSLPADLPKPPGE